MLTKTQISIVGGPNLFDLQLALFDPVPSVGNFTHRTVEVRVKDAPEEIVQVIYEAGEAIAAADNYCNTTPEQAKDILRRQNAAGKLSLYLFVTGMTRHKDDSTGKWLISGNIEFGHSSFGCSRSIPVQGLYAVNTRKGYLELIA